MHGSEKGVVARHEAGHAVVGTAVAKFIPGLTRVQVQPPFSSWFLCYLYSASAPKSVFEQMTSFPSYAWLSRLPPPSLAVKFLKCGVLFILQKLSILPRTGGALGFTYIPPGAEDRNLLFVDELRGRLVTLLGGRAAEEVVYHGRVSTGSLDDIKRATDLAYKAVAEYGLSPIIGPISLATLSGGGLDDTGSSFSWGKDQVISSFLAFGSKFMDDGDISNQVLWYVLFL